MAICMPTRGIILSSIQIRMEGWQKLLLQIHLFGQGVCIILGTIAEDIVTLGVGLADDPATIALGVGIIAGACYAKNRTNEQSVSNIDTKLKALGLSRIKLYSELNQKEQANMLGTFTEAAEWTDSVKGGYVSPYKSIQQKNDPTGNRIDMIFRGGYNLTDN